MNNWIYPTGTVFIFISLCSLFFYFIRIMINRRNDPIRKLNHTHKRKSGKGIIYGIVKAIRNEFIAAGYNSKEAIRKFFIAHIILFCSLIFFIILAGKSSGASTGRLVTITAALFAAALILSFMQLESKKRERQDKILKSLPYVLDLLVISVEAGLGLDTALMKITGKLKGPIAEEFSIAAKEIQMGKLRRLALQDMAARTGIGIFVSFISALNQADQLGVSIENILRTQSLAIRTYLRQKLDEQIAKISVKILFPLIIFMFPSIFVVLLGPSIIQLVKYLFHY